MLFRWVCLGFYIGIEVKQAYCSLISKLFHNWMDKNNDYELLLMIFDPWGFWLEFLSKQWIVYW